MCGAMEDGVIWRITADGRSALGDVHTQTRKCRQSQQPIRWWRGMQKEREEGGLNGENHAARDGREMGDTDEESRMDCA